MKRLFIAMLLLISIPSFALHVGIGAYATTPLSQQEIDGSRNILNFSPMAYFVSSYHLGGPHFIMPRFGIVYHLGTGDNYSKMTWMTTIDYGYRLLNNFILHGGLGTHLTRISGDGNAVTVNNGAGFKTAYQPAETSVSYTLVAHLGAEYILNPRWSMEVEFYSFGVLDDISYSISFNRFF